MVAVCNEIDRWPSPLPGLTLNLPLMGVVLQVGVGVVFDVRVGVASRTRP